MIHSNVTNKKILVTGANGFIGRALCRALLFNKFSVRARVRTLQKQNELLSFLEDTSHLLQCVVENDLTKLTQGMDTVVHLAARVHMMRDKAQDPLTEYRRANVILTENLARAAAAAGVRCFIYLSSIKVNGEFTLPNHPFTESDPPHPQDFYAQSKWEAEQKLLQIANETAMRVIIVRCPLVYGAGVQANFQKLIMAIQKNWPLPFGAINNRRSLIYVGNLVDAIIACIRNNTIKTHQVFLISDGDDVATPELIKRIAFVLNKSARLWTIPCVLLRFLGKITGKERAIDRLLSSLQIDNSKICQILAWKPPYSMKEALQKDFK